MGIFASALTDAVNARLVRRVTSLLLKLKRHELWMETLRKRAEKRASVSGDVSENKGVSCGKAKPIKTLSHSI
jgi:hypothetical protein